MPVSELEKCRLSSTPVFAYTANRMEFKISNPKDAGKQINQVFCCLIYESAKSHI